MKAAFIGFGNMAQVVAQGWLDQDVFAPDELYASARDYDKLCTNCEKFGIHPCISNQQAAEIADVIIIAVKPFMVKEALAGCEQALQDKMVVSFAAGLSFEDIESIVPGTHHVTAIPNTPIAIGEGILLVEEKNSLTVDQKGILARIFGPVALVQTLPWSLMNIGVTIAGCGPAFTAIYMEALSDAGVKYGLPRAQAYQLAARMTEGTAALYLHDQNHPGAMKDAVCSPKGTTIKGVCSLEKTGFRGSIIQAVEAIADADQK